MHKAIQESDQYSPRSIRRYERIFGADFLSSGGLETTAAICKSLDIAPGTRVLDVGSGLGGSAFHMQRTYGAVVTGVDTLPQMIALSTQRAVERGLDGVRFIEGDILDLDLPEASFDLAYSRDAFLYIEDKLALFRKLHRLLAPGGRLFVSDYGCGSAALSKEFMDYANGAGYFLRDPEAYGAVLTNAGFQEVRAEDATALFVDVLEREMEDIRRDTGDPEVDLDPEDKAYLLDRWERKVRWCRNGEMKWVHLRGSRS